MVEACLSDGITRSPSGNISRKKDKRPSIAKVFIVGGNNFIVNFLYVHDEKFGVSSGIVVGLGLFGFLVFNYKEPWHASPIFGTKGHGTENEYT